MGKYSKSLKAIFIPSDFTGIWITCDRGRENKTVSEITTLFELFHENLQSSVGPQLKLEEEIMALKFTSTASKPCVINIGNDIECIRLIRLSDPYSFVEAVFDKILNNDIFSLKYTHRIIPIERLCQAHLSDLISSSKDLLKKHFHQNQDSFTYSIIIESRMNNSLDKKVLISTFAELVGSSHKVDLKSPDKVIMVQILKNICTISVLTKYHARKRYNVGEYCAKLQ